MQTTCPECRTTFRVSQDQLGARRGLVRCGTCNAVFNAYDTLLPELESPPDDCSNQANPELTEVSDLQDLSPREPIIDVEEPSSAPVNEIVETVEAASEAPAITTVEVAAGLPLREETATPDILLEPIFPGTVRPQRTWKFWLYLLLAILLAALLALQTAYFFRAELAAAVPAARPVLVMYCRMLQCNVPLPRQLNQSAIVASSLEHDPENKSRVRLTLLLSNRSGQAQAWPSIVLTLSDVRQAPVAQKAFHPKAYLPKSVKVDDGLSDRGEREIRLDLDIGNLVASGYAVRLTYP